MHRCLTLLGAAALSSVAACATVGSSSQPISDQEHVLVDSPTGRYDMLLTKEHYLSSDTITVAPARAWPALLQTYASFGVPLQGADAPSRVVATQYLHVHGTFAGERMTRWIDCGNSITGEIASNYEVTLRFATVIDTSIAGRSVLRTAVTATAVATGSGSTPVECVTRGALEKRIAALVTSRSGS
jgi:hypothetical protein